jgi:hypothetical protein
MNVHLVRGALAANETPAASTVMLSSEDAELLSVEDTIVRLFIRHPLGRKIFLIERVEMLLETTLMALNQSILTHIYCSNLLKLIMAFNLYDT